jgi:hypothetical protein
MTQTEAIKKHLKAGKSLTFMQALMKFGCGNLKGRIYDLKKEGMRIDKEWIRTPITKKVVARYFEIK